MGPYIRRQKYRDLETGDRGHSRSSKILPFDRAYATSYSRSVATMALSGAVSDIFDFEGYDDLQIRVRGQSRPLKMVQFDRSPMICY